MISPCPAQILPVCSPRDEKKPLVDFSLILPTYNERENLAELFRRIDCVLSGYNFEVILVDDDSPDGTWHAAQELRSHYDWLHVIRRRGRRGLSSAVLCGFRHARGKLLGVMDADLQHDHTRLPMLLEKMNACDFAVATRRAAGGSDGNWNQIRRATSWMATQLAKRIARTPLSDPMSGFFIMRQEIFAAIDAPELRPQGYKILLYLHARAVESIGSRVRLGEVGYEFGERQCGQSKFTTKVALQFLAMLLELRLHRRLVFASPQLAPVRA